MLSLIELSVFPSPRVFPRVCYISPARVPSGPNWLPAKYGTVRLGP